MKVAQYLMKSRPMFRLLNLQKRGRFTCGALFGVTLSTLHKCLAPLLLYANKYRCMKALGKEVNVMHGIQVILSENSARITDESRTIFEEIQANVPAAQSSKTRKVYKRPIFPEQKYIVSKLAARFPAPFRSSLPTLSTMRTNENPMDENFDWLSPYVSSNTEAANLDTPPLLTFYGIDSRLPSFDEI
ncbi:unnamed protein product [Dicrocoelium dendriticum]|nr:unnamed protein product [Dicrocoelium dendriticum]